MNHARCASYHFAPWLIEPHWFHTAVEAVRSGVLIARGETVGVRDEEDDDDGYEDPRRRYQKHGPVALIHVVGAMMKPRSKFGGTSSIDVRAMVRKAVADETVTAILLCFDSPGGTHAGTDALARDVAAADARKPVYAHGDDMLASAAYYVASQARRITATPTSLIGSLGSRLTIVDSSEAAEMEGLKVIDLSTGEFKGTGQPGTEITKRQIAYLQDIVDKSGDAFKAAVMAGRKMDRAKVDALFDGRMHDAADAVSLGLVDEVLPLDAVLARIAADHPLLPKQQTAPAPAYSSGHGATQAYPAAAYRSMSYAAQPR